MPTPPLRAPPPTDADPTSRGPTSARYRSLMIFISWKLNAHILFVLLYNPDPEYQKITFSYAISKRKLQAHKIAYWKMELYVLNNQLFFQILTAFRIGTFIYKKLISVKRAMKAEQ